MRGAAPTPPTRLLPSVRMPVRCRGFRLRLRTCSRSPALRPMPKRLPEKFEIDGPVVAALRRQLATVMGKTHMVEFAFGGTGHNAHYGSPHNPWDATVHRSPGGSSSGAGVSLCEGSALLALGTDTAASVRLPAAMTGNAGVKFT